jgi:hypothetical protein
MVTRQQELIKNYELRFVLPNDEVCVHTHTDPNVLKNRVVADLSAFDKNKPTFETTANGVILGYHPAYMNGETPIAWIGELPDLPVFMTTTPIVETLRKAA